MSDETIERMKARARLALRAERAMGIRSLPIELVRDAHPSKSPPASRAAPAALRAPPASASPSAPAAQLDQPTPPRPSSARATPAKQQISIPGLPPSPAVDFSMPTDVIGSPVLDRPGKIVALKTLDEKHVSVCTKCRLHETRTHTVFGEGDPDARLMFIGEGPGENEDLQGRPFVGQAGQLLEKMINAMGFSREQVFICNIVKCRPPNNREPAADETATCTPYLLQQIEIVRPHAIVTLGRPATQFMLGSKLSMGRLRGQWQSWRGIKLMPTYHPAYVLRQYTRETREAVWSDLKQVLAELKASAPG